MFLDKTCRKIIKFMRDTPPNMKDGLFTSDYIAEQCSVDIKHCQIFLEHLEEQRLVKIHTIPWPTANNIAIWGYSLMPRGIAYSEYRRHEFMTLLLKSILLPVVVAIVTSILIA